MFVEDASSPDGSKTSIQPRSKEILLKQLLLLPENAHHKLARFPNMALAFQILKPLEGKECQGHCIGEDVDSEESVDK